MKNKNQIVRLKSIIDNDRMEYNDEFLNLLNIDLEKLLKEYFSYNDKTEIRILKAGDRYKVEISFFATQLRPFAILPE